MTDLLIANGSVFTGLAERPAPGSVLVRDGLIAAVGAASEIAALTPPGTEQVDAAGGLVSAGFQDAHCHPVLAGLQQLSCDLSGADDADGYLAIIARYAATHPDDDWIIGGGWAMPDFPGGTPTRHLLDAVVADRPVYLINRDAHGAWVNTAALRQAGIDAATSDPADGRIEREPDGFPSGTLHEGATALVTRRLPTPDDDTTYQALLVAQNHLLSLGITAWQDAIIGSYLGQPDNTSAYLLAVAADTLRARVVGALWWSRSGGIEQVAELVVRRAELSGGRFRAGTVKMMLDGVAENATASMVQPYLDRCGHPTANRGVDFVDPTLLGDFVTALDSHDFQVHFHALGDGAVRSALTALEQAKAQNGTGRRHHLAHLQVVHPDDIARFAAVGATANLQALWATHEPQLDELVIPFLGPERDAMQYPFAALAAAGTRLAAGSDWPVSSADPIEAIHVAVNRSTYGSDEPPLHAEQRLQLAQIWRAYTAGSAYLNGLDHRTGTIEVGKDADLIVLDSDPFALPVTEIGTARVLQTYLAGELAAAAQ